MQYNVKDTITRCCRGYTFLRIPGPERNASEVREGLGKGSKEWLKALMKQYTGNGLQSEQSARAVVHDGSVGP